LEKKMAERTRSGSSLLLALPIGSTIGGIGATAAWSSSAAEFISSLSYRSTFLMSLPGVAFGLLPYLLIAVPACLSLERHIPSATTRALILAFGGAGIGGAISALTMDVRMVEWAVMVGGSTGLVLGILRQHRGQPTRN
jgi:hypothetical protein